MILNNSTNINNKKECLNNDCQQFHQYQQQQQKRIFKQWFSTIPPISTTKKECLNNDCQQVHEYQQTKKKV